MNYPLFKNDLEFQKRYNTELEKEKEEALHKIEELTQLFAHSDLATEAGLGFRRRQKNLGFQPKTAMC